MQGQTVAPRPMRPPVQPPTHLGSFPPGCRRAHLGKAPGAGGAQPCPPHPLHTHTQTLSLDEQGREIPGIHTQKQASWGRSWGPALAQPASQGALSSPLPAGLGTRGGRPPSCFSRGAGGRGRGLPCLVPQPPPPDPGAECGAGGGGGVGCRFLRIRYCVQCPRPEWPSWRALLSGRGSSRSGSERAGWEPRDCFGM